ncbi:hypothetical protein OE88DRAFT_1005099 [Heliocybe sulcata]|uniref:Uncharacterized protein n=1 Tax=Heliocybe sulcata TaxID=5364 RepID=A0A5C3NNE8_9AGAM|nr:hypothetical protein OE88DRAFT_1005099 [Heliocybe sulcata]
MRCCETCKKRMISWHGQLNGRRTVRRTRRINDVLDDGTLPVPALSWLLRRHFCLTMERNGEYIRACATRQYEAAQLSPWPDHPSCSLWQSLCAAGVCLTSVMSQVSFFRVYDRSLRQSSAFATFAGRTFAVLCAVCAYRVQYRR